MNQELSVQGKKLLLIGGIKQACEIINEAKKMGVETFVTDYLEESPAKKIADHSFMVDATDVDGLVKLCQEQKIDGVITGYVDMLLPYCQQVCERLGMHFWGNADNINMCVNKELFKAACNASDVPVVPGVEATRENYREVIKKVSVPVVVKPVDNSGSRGVIKCYDQEKLLECVEKSLAFSKAGIVLIEKAMNPNNEFSAYYMLDNGNYYLTCMGDRYVEIISDDIAPIGKGMTYPSVHLDLWMNEVHSAVCRFFDANGMKNGFAFFQGFYDEDDGKLYIHEIGYRPVGGFSFKYVEHFSGYNRIQELIRYCLIGRMDSEAVAKSNPHFDGYAMTVTASVKPGTIGEVIGADEIRENEHVLHMLQLHELGEQIPETSQGTLASVLFYILCVAKTETELKEIVSMIQQKLSVKSITGENMLNEMLTQSQLSI